MNAETKPTPRPACPVCHRPDPHGHSWACCAGCVADVDAMLGEILDLKAQACDPENLARGRSGDTGPIGAHRDPPPPASPGAVSPMSDHDQLCPLADKPTDLQSWGFMASECRCTLIARVRADERERIRRAYHLEERVR